VKLITSTLFTIYLKAKTHIKHFFIYSYINSGVKGLIYFSSFLREINFVARYL